MPMTNRASENVSFIQMPEQIPQDNFLVSARVVEESTFRPLAHAIPIREVNKCRIALFLCLALIIVLAIIIPSILLLPSKHDSESLFESPHSSTPTQIDTQTPVETLTEAPTDIELEWMQLGDQLNRQVSDDQAGFAVAISRNGMSVAIGAPGTYGHGVGGAVQVSRYKAHDWEKLAEISCPSGPSGNDMSSISVALDDTGLIVAIGNPFALDDENEEDYPTSITSAPSQMHVYGSVRVFRVNESATDVYDDSSYEQIGSDILGPEIGSEFGWSVDISGKGDIVAMGSRSSCYVQIVSFSESSQDWEDFGQAINCTGVIDDSFGTSVRLSSSGSILAVGAPIIYDSNDSLNIDNFPVVDDLSRSGRVRVYKHDGLHWNNMGNLIEGVAAGDGFGFAVALSDDGTVLACCAPFYDKGRSPITSGNITKDPSRGSCRVFTYNATQDNWKQLGLDIDGEDNYDQFGTSVSMDASGNVIAVGAAGSYENGENSGLVQVFQYDDDKNMWIQVGQDIPGFSSEALFGRSVALSADGDIITIGSPDNIKFSTYRPGSVRVYETGITLKNGDFPIDIVIYTDEYYPDDISWSVERLDVERKETFNVINVPVGTYTIGNQTETTNLMLPDAGVFRFEINSFYSWYEIKIPRENGNDELIARKQVNETTQFSTHTFVSQSKQEFPVGNRNVTLVIDFDDYPEEVHWVLVQSDLVMDHEFNKLKNKRTLLGFGPEEEFDSSLAGTQLIVVIDVSQTTAESSLKLIISDDGRDGLCCDYGMGMFRLYNGTFHSDNSDNLLVAGTAEGKRREVHPFKL
jgi:hypothetical protein